MATPDKDLASGELVGTQTPFLLFAGDAPIITEEEILDTGNLAKYTVVGKIAATGKVVVLNPAANDGSEKAYGITTQAADATAADVKLACYTGGFFNHAALVWPAALNTLALRKAAFQGTPVKIGSVRL